MKTPLPLIFLLVFLTASSQINASSLERPSIARGLQHKPQLVLSDQKHQQFHPNQELKLTPLNKIPNSKVSPPSLAKLTGLFTLWYLSSASFNVFNSHIKSFFPYPWMSATLQFGMGLLYVLPMWLFGYRKAPNVSLEDLRRILPIAILNAGGHALTVNAMFQKGGGSFTHVIKASEPVVSVLVDLLVNWKLPRPLTALTLLPITYGVAFASTLGKLDPKTMASEFTSKAAMLAMGSNIAYAFRALLRKGLPPDFKRRTNLDPQNEQGLTTLLSTLLLLPIALALEPLAPMGTKVSSLLPAQRMSLALNTLLCGLSFYFSSEIQNMVLGSLGPVPTAVGNTLKRVVVLVALYLFTKGESFPFNKILGCAIAVTGCLGFAICDSLKL